MASRKPNLTLPLPEKEQPDFQLSSTSTTSLRSPRFIENFDAPFSEAIMNASSATLATDTMTFPSTSSSSNDRASFGDESRPQPPFSRNNSGLVSPSPLRQRHSTWESDTKRRAKINDRIREWARKSWGAARGRPDTRSGYFDSNPKHSKSSAALPSSPGDVSPTESEGYGRGAGYARAVATSTTLPKSS
ncbi:hypothetical protein B0T10DRAFT_105827 [Thelonectria olida]|uniref:Uncharacterized protein n=1 Tax=Thelonectria olida TaxID=1576542 RepID=A0A9P8WJ78_9HYPO|nr:hypothetical protein B0T10DRAFT_105827 [Thelonectria olida]